MGDVRAAKAELVKFLHENTSIEKNLPLLGIDLNDLDNIFIGERDGEEVRIRWGVDGQFTPPVVFEAVGVEGLRLVAGDEVHEVDNVEYDKLWAGKGKLITPDLFPEGEGQSE